MMKQRFFIILALTLILSTPVLAQQQPLTPEQQKLLDAFLSSYDPKTREKIRPSLMDLVTKINPKDAERMLNPKGAQGRSTQADQRSANRNGTMQVPVLPPANQLGQVPHVAAVTSVSANGQASSNISQIRAALDPTLRRLWTANMQFDQILKNKETQLRAVIAAQRFEAYGEKRPFKLTFQIVNEQATPAYTDLQQSIESRLPANTIPRLAPDAVRSTFDNGVVTQAIDTAYTQFHGLAVKYGQEAERMRQTGAGRLAPAAIQQAQLDLTARYQQQVDSIINDLAKRLTQLRPSFQQLDKVLSLRPVQK